MKELIKKIGVGIICAILLVSGRNAYVSAEESAEIENKLISTAVERVLEGYNDYYTISSYDWTAGELEIADNHATLNLFVTFLGTMIEKSIGETAYVKGMCDALQIPNTAEAIDNLIASDDILSADQSVVACVVGQEIADYAKYIGVETDFNFYLKVEADLDEIGVVEDSIEVYAENIEEYIPLEEMFPSPRNELYEQGRAHVQDIENVYEANAAQVGLLAETRSYERNYGYLVEYATTYTSNTDDSTVCDCGSSSCSAKQQKAYWNNSQYGYYDSLLHNDCADFISQAMYYAGVAEDESWYATQGGTTRSIVWVNVARLESCMTHRGVWSSIAKSDVTYGDIVRYTDFSHVVMVTYKDADNTVKYSGHTRDRLNFTFKLDDNRMVYYRVMFGK